MITWETGIQETQELSVNTIVENASNKVSVEYLYYKEKLVEMEQPFMKPLKEHKLLPPRLKRNPRLPHTQANMPCAGPSQQGQG